ncbi:MAG TPA: hypothetical protein VN193_04255 [Candidatus Angelobacter sp.]|jgi:hypothetical protein|nr:hypothetical protein [Candidatus Angelobacter sp.]
MHVNRKRLRRGALIVSGAGTLAVLATGLLPVAAQVIGDPLGLISIGTSSSDNPSGSVLAVSNGGNASGGTGAGVSTTGSASGSLVAVSGTGCANTGNTFAFAPVAASGTGCAGGQGTTVSGTGDGCGTGLVGISAAGDSCGLVAVAGDRASGTYYADGYGQAGAEGNDLVGNTGVSLIYTPPSAIQIQSTAVKEQALAQTMPAVLQNLASHATNGVASSPASSACCTNSVRPSTTTSDHNPPDSYAFPSMPQTYQKAYWSCGSAATELWWWAKYGSDPGESTWYQSEQTYQNGKHAGTSTGLIADAIDNREGHTDMGQSQQSPTADTLQGMVETDEWEYTEAVIANVDTGDLSYWDSSNGTPHAYGHMVTLYGWDSNAGGHIWFDDTYDTSRTPGAGQQNYNPFGTHLVSSAQAAAAVDASIDKNVVW